MLSTLSIDELPYYSLLVDPSATTETATAHAGEMRDSLLAASAEKRRSTSTSAGRDSTLSESP